jgi:hypothetical protein
LVSGNSSRNWVAGFQPAFSKAGVMYLVQMSRSVRLFLFIFYFKIAFGFKGLKLFRYSGGALGNQGFRGPCINSSINHMGWSPVRLLNHRKENSAIIAGLLASSRSR